MKKKVLSGFLFVLELAGLISIWNYAETYPSAPFPTYPFLLALLMVLASIVLFVLEMREKKRRRRRS